MPPSDRIKPWLSVEKMFQWLQKASGQSSYKRRMAIWLTLTGRLSASKVAEILGVSDQAVWLWLRQFNSLGPKGLERKGRGGRRWGFMTLQQEADLLKPLIRRARTGGVPKTLEIKRLVEQKLGRKVSVPYVYRLLHRHRWYETIAQSRPAVRAPKDDFRKLSRPWLRQN